jgi:hypothetical protein
MSTSDPASKAAELAARQVEHIVDAAQTAAEEIKESAKRSMDELSRIHITEPTRPIIIADDVVSM